MMDDVIIKIPGALFLAIQFVAAMIVGYAGVAFLAAGIYWWWPTTAGDRERAYRDAKCRIEGDSE